MLLAELKRGQSALVKALKCDGELKTRLLSMGLGQGEKVTVLSKSSGGATVEVMLFSGRLALRNGEAKAIEVEKVA